MSQNTPAGWYPQQDGTERWWDGQAWTSHHRLAPPPPTAPMVTPHHPGGPGRYGAEPVTTSPYGALAPPGPMGYVVAPKNPTVSLIASFFIPGLGTMLNGDVGKGVAILVGYFACLFLFFLILPLLVAVGLWVWGMVDAYQGAQQWNRRHGIAS
jgi:TM2 domain-containing membrane protein YozV